MKNMIIVAALSVVSFVSISASAATQQNYCDTDAIPRDEQETCKNVPSNRREELGRLVSGGNPVAFTNKRGVLKAYYTVGAPKLQSCTITEDVKQFKMSQNSKDLSTVYFLKHDGQLFDAKMTGYVGLGQCPKASTQNYSQTTRLTSADKVVEFTLASNSRSNKTMAARTTSNIVIYSTDQNIYVQGRYYSADAADEGMKSLLKN